MFYYSTILLVYVVIGTTFLQGAVTPNNEYVSLRYGFGHAYFVDLLRGLSRSFFYYILETLDKQMKHLLDFRRSYEIIRRAHPRGWAYLG